MARRRLLRVIKPKRQQDVLEGLDQAGTFGLDFVLLVVLSCIIATFGLVLNSAAVIIGAMLIAPLMSPILRCSLALIRGDLSRFSNALLTLIGGVVLAIGISALLGLLVTIGPFNFLEELPSEVLNRTHPSLFDLVVALAGGAAAAYALAQPQLSASLAGVAIATALMPPLCTVGIGLAQWRSDIGGGALLLFLVNFSAIVFASSLVFILLGFRAERREHRHVVLSRALMIEIGLMLVVVIPLSGLMVGIINDATEDRIIRTTLIAELQTIGNADLVSFDRRTKDDQLNITATVRAPQSLTYSEAMRVQQALATKLQKTIALKLVVVPVTSLEAYVPPTLTPTPEPGAPPTFTPTPTPTLVPSPLPAPTLTPVPTATPAPARVPTPTSVPVQYAVVSGTDGAGLNLRREPGRTQITARVREGDVLQLIGQQAQTEGIGWTQVVLTDGRVGWVASEYLVPYRLFIQP